MGGGAGMNLAAYILSYFGQDYGFISILPFPEMDSEGYVAVKIKGG